jgi:hypothetical protein
MPPPEAALDGLATAVERALERVSQMQDRLRVAEGRRDELEGLLAKMADGSANPAEMLTRLKSLEIENADLARRLDDGREGVERLLAKIRFLEEQR